MFLFVHALILSYIDKIRAVTFGWTFRELSREATAKLIDYHKRFLETPEDQSWRDDAELQALAQVIRDAKAAEGWTKIFIRLSSRSPKDAALNSPRLMHIFEEELEKIKTSEASSASSASSASLVNQKFQALYRFDHGRFLLTVTVRRRG
jgi:hypothetical protein